MNETFPTTAEELTPQRLTDYLRASGHLAHGSVATADSKTIGTGKMGDNVRIRLGYDGDSGSAPATLVAKFPAADEQARAMAGLQGAYYSEVMFYREFAARTEMRTPKIYGSELSEDKTSFLLLMEDMTPAEPGSQFVGESRKRASVALAESAKLASAFYGDESVAATDHVLSAVRDDGGAFGQLLMEQKWPEFVTRFGHGMSDEGIAFGERYVAGHSHFVSRFQGPKTLVHADFRTENILYDGNVATIVDWQTPSESSVMTDAAYFMGGSVEVEDRRAWEKDLVGEFRSHLSKLGVELSFQDCWDQYREYAMHGLLLTVLGACFTGPEERSDRMFLTMIQRHLQHCLDLDSVEFLP